MNTDPQLAKEIARRRTFAIISHPDAGKTTLTEKLLLYGGAVHIAGSVKGRRAERHATSDWMAMEQERGISIATSVMQFEYGGCHMNLLDTPGHNDFSEDTYRTLTAADCAVMLIDHMKGIEAQTIKLFQVCRMRGIPIVTFINKMDRLGRPPLELCDEVEKVLGIATSPANWPVGSGQNFQGVYDRWGKRLLRFERGADGGAHIVDAVEMALDDPALRRTLGDRAYDELSQELELLDIAGDTFDGAAFLRGELTPVFFGSALTNFGVETLLDALIEMAPAPGPRLSNGAALDPATPGLSGFVFKIQANMDPRHRDRVAFVRICSGKFTRGMTVKHPRLGKDLTLARSVQFMAQERVSVEEAVAGDILGLWDPGNLRIGDALSTIDGVHFDGIPRFSPEYFARVVLKDPMKRKQLKKGLEQLSEEGAVQVFYDRQAMEREPVLGAVGMLQFEVVQHRLLNEYSVKATFEMLPFTHARWIEGEHDPDELERRIGTTCLVDVEGRSIVLFASEWTMRRAIDKFPETTFVAAVQPGRIAR